MVVFPFVSILKQKSLVFYAISIANLYLRTAVAFSIDSCKQTDTELLLFTAFTYSFLILGVFFILFFSQVNEGWGKRMQVLSSCRSISTVNRSVRTSMLSSRLYFLIWMLVTFIKYSSSVLLKRVWNVGFSPSFQPLWLYCLWMLRMNRFDDRNAQLGTEQHDLRKSLNKQPHILYSLHV